MNFRATLRKIVANKKVRIGLACAIVLTAVSALPGPVEEASAATPCQRTHYSNGDVYEYCPDSGRTCWYWEQDGQAESSCYYV